MKESFPLPKNQEQKFSSDQALFLDQKVKTMKDGALLEEDFEGREYTTEFVAAKKEEVAKIKKQFEIENKISELKSEVEENYGLSEEYRKASEYLEALFYEKLGGKDGWIPGAMVWKTSEYDDYINAIDFVVETENKELALGTDVTFSHGKGLRQKLTKIKEAIDGGALPELMFYDSNKEDKRPMPRAVIAVERDKIIKALKLWADTEGDESFQNLLHNHPLRAKTMLELELQLESFALYAKNIGRREIASAYNDLLAQIQLLIVDHEETIRKYKNIIDDDSAYQTILSFCEELKTSKSTASSVG